MANLTDKDILKLAHLSRLKLSEEEVQSFKKDINAILEYVEQLQSVDLTGVEPTNQVTGLTNVMRPDEVKAYGPDQTALLKNAPSTENGQIKVRRVL